MSFLFGFVMAAIIAYLIARGARSRGMSGVGWGVFTVLAWIIAIPAYLIVRLLQIGEQR